MDLSLDKFYAKVFRSGGHTQQQHLPPQQMTEQKIPENVLGKIAFSV